jgi:hypothetical protein
MLLEADFTTDDFNSIYEVNKDNTKLFLAYRLAKYAQQNKFAGYEYLDRPITAVKIFLQELQDKFNANFLDEDVICLLLDYVIQNSYLLTQQDVGLIFGAEVQDKTILLQQFNTIAESRAFITPTKIKNYSDRFPKKVMMIKAAIVIAELQMLELNKAKKFPIKIYERYIPMFSTYSDISDVMTSELKVWLLQKLKAAQSDKAYSLTTGDLFRYFAILKAQNVDISNLRQGR